MIKLETHCHVLGGSKCAYAPAEIIAERYSKEKYGAICFTTHYNEGYFNNYPGRNKKEKLDYFFSLFDNAEKICERYGLKSFFGVEITANEEKYQEYTYYGFERKFLYDSRELFKYSQKELFEIAEDNGIFMYQTHPFRERITTGNPKYMHGAEAFNGHFHHVNNNALANAFCEENNLVKMSGTDFHKPEQPITAGMYISENVHTEKELTDFIRSGKATLIENASLYESELKRYKEEIAKCK